MERLLCGSGCVKVGHVEVVMSTWFTCIAWRCPERKCFYCRCLMLGPDRAPMLFCLGSLLKDRSQTHTYVICLMILDSMHACLYVCICMYVFEYITSGPSRAIATHCQLLRGLLMGFFPKHTFV